VTWTIREGRVEEIDRLVALRRTMFEAMGHQDPALLDRVGDACRRYFRANIPTGTLRVWAAIDEASGDLIASIGLVVHTVPPGPFNLAGKEGYIMNLVTLPAWRRRGVARALLTRVLGVLRAEDVPVASLHASSAGRRLYEELGFEIDDRFPEMRLRLTRR